MNTLPFKISSIVLLLMASSTASVAAEIYNKDGNKLDLYGKLDALHQISNNDGVDGDGTYVRVGLKGETQITPSLSGYGQWELQFNPNRAESESDNMTTRVGFAGLHTEKYGSIDYGRNYGVIYDIAAWTDVLPEFGGDAYGIDNFMFKRTGNVLTYRNNTLIDGIKIVLQYQGRNEGPGETINGRSNILGQNGDGYGASLIKEWDNGLSVGATFSSSKRTDDQNTKLNYGNGDKANVYRAGVKYDANSIYLAATYTESYNATTFGSGSVSGFANHAQITELTAKYFFNNGVVPVVSYLQTKGKDIEGNAAKNYGDQDLLNYLAVGAAYYFNKNISTAVMYKFNFLNNNEFTEKSGINTDDVLALDLVYQF